MRDSNRNMFSWTLFSHVQLILYPYFIPYFFLPAIATALPFLVLAFAQPFVPASEDQSAETDIIIYLDNSMSMTNEVDIDQTAFESGINFIYQIIDLFPQESRFKLLTNDFAPYSNSFKGNRCSIFFRLPVSRLSTPITWAPFSIKKSHRCDPINPAAPVISTLISSII